MTDKPQGNTYCNQGYPCPQHGDLHATRAMTAEESLRELIKAAVELVIIRHLQSEEEGEELDIEFLAADTANACFGVDTCAMEPIPELAELLRRLQPEPATRRLALSEIPGSLLNDGITEVEVPAEAHSSSAGPEPRCPKCGHDGIDLTLFAEIPIEIHCYKCKSHWKPRDWKSLAQFFPASQQVPQREGFVVGDAVLSSLQAKAGDPIAPYPLVPVAASQQVDVNDLAATIWNINWERECNELPVMNKDELAAVLQKAMGAATPVQPIPVDGKFGILGDRLVNLVSLEPIPSDEPLFLLRARDHHAIRVLKAYNDICAEDCNNLHMAGIKQIIDRFAAFATERPERMKQPGITRHLKLERATRPERKEG